MSKNYTDITAIVQVVGCIYQNPSLIDEEKYFLMKKILLKSFIKFYLVQYIICINLELKILHLIQ